MRSVWAVRSLRLLAAAVAVSAGTGVLLSVPPLSFIIYPVYSHVYVLHGWLSIAVAVPFMVGVVAHGVPAWRARGWSAFTRTGLLLTVAFVVVLASGLFSKFSDTAPPWVLFVHIGAGIVTFVATFLHAPRFWRPVTGP